MKLELEKEEIEDAIVAFINDMGINTDNKKVEVNLVAGRVGGGNRAEITISPLPATAEETPAAPAGNTTKKEAKQETKKDESGEDSLFNS